MSEVLTHFGMSIDAENHGERNRGRWFVTQSSRFIHRAISMAPTCVFGSKASSNTRDRPHQTSVVQEYMSQSIWMTTLIRIQSNSGTLMFVLPEGMHLPANTIGINATAQAHRRTLRAQIHRKPATNKLWLSPTDLSIGSFRLLNECLS